MEHNQYDLLEVLEQIEPAELDYQQWLNVGMALELEGYSVDTWDAWSRKDPGRYHSGECPKKVDRIFRFRLSCHRRNHCTVCERAGMDASL